MNYYQTNPPTSFHKFRCDVCLNLEILRLVERLDQCLMYRVDQKLKVGLSTKINP